MDISVIVPVYNVEQYLPKCIDSILAQTFTNFELLLINDGSTDGGGTICDACAAKDGRIKVFHIPNGGVAKARQLGVENSSGEYVIFVDSDDWLPLDSIETLYKGMTDDVDIVIGGYTKVGTTTNKDCVYDYDLLFAEQYLNLSLRYKIHFSPWARMYRRTLLKYSTFPPLKKGEDALMNFEVGIYVRNVSFVKQSVYFYYEREDSAVKVNKLTFEEEKRISYYVYSLFERCGLYEKHKDSIMVFSFYRIYKSISDFKENLNVNDEWCKRILRDSKGDNLQHKVLRLGLKSKFVYNLIRYCLFAGSKIKQNLRVVLASIKKNLISK